MIKMIFCLRRRLDFDRDAFQSYWREHHLPLVMDVAPVLRIRRYVQSHAIDDPRIAAVAGVRGTPIAPYDGVAELGWDSFEDVIAAGNSKEARDAGRLLLEDERKFIDLSHSPLFWTREDVAI